MSRLDQVINLLTDKKRKTVAAELEAMELSSGLVNQKIKYIPDFSSYTIKELRDILAAFFSNPEDFTKKAAIEFLKTEPEYTYETLLGLAIGMGKYDAIPVLLRAGADPNGTTPEGFVYTPPIFYTPFIKKDSDYYNVVNQLLEAGANINQTTLGDIGIILRTITITRDPSSVDKKIRYLLGKGANPDGTRTFPTLHTDELTPSIVRILLYFGANPNFKNRNGTTVFDLIPYGPIREILDKSYEQILNECDDPVLLRKIANAYKVPSKEADFLDPKKRKEICSCIQTIRDNMTEIDFDDIRERRKKKVGEAFNENTLSYASSIYEFMNDELIILESPKGRFVFHVSEIPILLKGKNPYTTEPLPPGFLKSVIERYEYFPEYTTESAEEIFQPYPKDSVSSRESIDRLNSYIKSYNTYIDAENLTEVNTGMLTRIPRILEETTPGLVIGEDLIPFRTRDPDMNSRDYATRIITVLLSLLKYRKVQIPQVTNAVQQVINDNRIINDIKDELDIFWEINKNYLRYLSLDQLSTVVGREKADRVREIVSQDPDPAGYYDFIRDFFVFY